MGDLPDGYDHKYTYSHVGYNLKVTDMQAACALGQLTHLDDFIERRRSNFTYLNNRLAFMAEFAHLPVVSKKMQIRLVRVRYILKRKFSSFEKPGCSTPE